MELREKKKLAYKVSILSIIMNIFLSVIKIIVGFIGHSAVLISDGIHSVSDVFSTFLVLFGIEISTKEADESHQYGHERIESIVGNYLSVFLIIVALMIGYQGITKLITHAELAVPSTEALYVAILSVLIKEGMYQVTRRAGEKIGSSSMVADAWHHRSDALSSVGSFFGILFSRLGYPVMDPVFSLIICVFILKAAYEIAASSIERLVDKACDAETEEKMKEFILSVDGVKGISDFKTRLFADSKYVDASIYVEGSLTVKEGHEIANRVHYGIENNFAPVKHCMVHVDPIEG